MMADRNSVALEIEGISSHMLDLANSALAGTYLFGGTVFDDQTVYDCGRWNC